MRACLGRHQGPNAIRALTMNGWSGIIWANATRGREERRRWIQLHTADGTAGCRPTRRRRRRRYLTHHEFQGHRDAQAAWKQSLWFGCVDGDDLDSGVARPRIEDEDDDDQGAGRLLLSRDAMDEMMRRIWRL
jgi:hypothetical protein